MTKITSIITKENIEIPQEATICAITLFVDSASAGQTTAVWDLTKENCLSFANNQIQGYVYTHNGKIIIKNIIAYVVFFN